MSLTAAQQTALEANINANTNTIPSGQPWTLGFAGVQVKNIPQGNDFDGATAVAGWYNQVASPEFFVFRSNIPNTDVFNQILWANYTPSAAPDNTVTWSNQSLACQGKQFNLQMLLQPGGVFNAGLPNLRTGLKDATTALPTGTSGANQDGGWNATIKNVPGVLCRDATFFEKLFATFTTGPLATGNSTNLGSATNVALLVVEGQLSTNDIFRLPGWNP